MTPSMPMLYIPAPDGGRVPVRVTPGQTLAEAAQQHRCMEGAAAWGVEEYKGDCWALRPLSTRVQAGRVYRVAYPAQAPAPRASLLQTLLGLVRRVKRG